MTEVVIGLQIHFLHGGVLKKCANFLQKPQMINFPLGQQRRQRVSGQGLLHIMVNL